MILSIGIDAIKKAPRKEALSDIYKVIKTYDFLLIAYDYN